MTHRSAALLFLAAVALSACGRVDSDAEYSNAACRQAVYDDAAVKAAMRGLGQTNTQLGASSIVREAKDDAYTKCLRDNGLAPTGGVERVKRGWM